MIKQLVIIDYTQLSDSELNEFAPSVYAALNGNTNFTWPVDKLTGFKAKCDDYSTKLIESRTRDFLKIEEKNISRRILLDELHDSGIEINRQSNGDILKAMSSGFKMIDEGSMIGPLPIPTDFKVVTGKNPGELKCSCKANINARMYHFFFAPVPEPADISDWKLKVSSTRSKVFNGFKSGQQYAIKCAYRGTSDDLNYSNTIYIYVQ